MISEAELARQRRLEEEREEVKKGIVDLFYGFMTAFREFPELDAVAAY